MAAQPTYYTPPQQSLPGDNIYDANQRQAGNDNVPGRDTSDALNAYLSRQPGETDDELHARMAAWKANQPPPDYSHDKPRFNSAAGADNSGVGSGPAAPTGSPNSPMVTADGSVPPGVPWNPAPPNPPPSLPVSVGAQPVAKAGPAGGDTAGPGTQISSDFPPPPNSQIQDATTGQNVGPTINPSPANSQQIIDGFWSAITQEGRTSLTPQDLQGIIAANPGVHMVPGSQDKVQLPNGQIVDVIQDSGGANKPSWSISGGQPGENGQTTTAGGGSGGSGGQGAAYTPPRPPTVLPPSGGGAATQTGLKPGEVNPLAPGGGVTPEAPTTQMPTYDPSNITQYTPPNIDMTGVDKLVGELGSAQSPTYTPSDITQYQAPNDAAGQSSLDTLVQQIIGGQAPTYQGANISQFQQSSNPEINALQDQQMKAILSNPTYSDDYKNKLMESQKELIANRGQADTLALKQNAARRGVTDSGATGAAQRRLDTGVTTNLLKSNRDIDLNTTGANRQSILDALSASQGVLGSRAGIESQGYASKLSGQEAQAQEGSKEYQSKLDAEQLKNTKATTVGNILNQRSANSIGQYGATLQGQQAQAAEKGKAYQSMVDAITQKNATASNLAGIASTKSGIANSQYATGLAGQQAQADERARAYQSRADAAKMAEQARQFNTSSGLARDQFNENTRQFDQNFIEQVRQFDAQLAQQMTQFNASNSLGWANNQQGYDIANLNSQNSLIDKLLGA